MDYLVEYDKSDPISIEMYSQRMIGKTFREICEEDDARGASVLREEGTSYGTDEVAETKRNNVSLTMHATATLELIFMRQELN